MDKVNLQKRVEDYLSKLNGVIGVAVSGGRDSMALLHLLMNFQGKYKIVAINVEHGIRGANSIEDSLFVKEFCDRNSIPLYSISVSAPTYAKENKITIEQAGRELRYDFFSTLLREKKVDKIALAHHLDDQCETLLMRIFRGTGLEGLKGIRDRDDYIRPFLNVTRKEIDEYILENSIEYREDETNAENDASRNVLRNTILPLIENRWQGYRTSLKRLSESVCEIDDFLDIFTITPELDGGAVKFPIEQLKGLHIAILKRSLRNGMEYFNNAIDFSATSYDDIISLISKGNGTCIDLPHGVRAWREEGYIVLERNNSDEDRVLTVNDGTFEFGGAIWAVVERTTEILRFDLDKLPKNAQIRAGRTGDVFKKFGGYTLKLGDFYTNKKVPLRIRKRIPVIAVDNRVLVTPYEISDDVKCDGNSSKIYTLKMIKWTLKADYDKHE